MTDVFTEEKRSWIMSRVKNRDTRPEMLVRSVVHRLGFRFRLHDRDLPGHPDIILPRHRKIIFVHGCFWHSHPQCPRAKRPDDNRDFWEQKLSRNVERDASNQKKLSEIGWDVLVVWECETKDAARLLRKLESFLRKEE